MCRFEEFKKEPTDEEDMGSESLPELAALLPENNYSGMHPSQISRTPIHGT
jgi:hypothetical protein